MVMWFFFCCNLFVASEVLSNLPLQMALYFNVVFAPVWFLVLVVFLADTVNVLHTQSFIFIKNIAFSFIATTNSTNSLQLQ